jgi:leucyl-tRNA synthetase
MMICINEIGGEGVAAPRMYVETLVKLVAPFAPHIAEELWSQLGHSESIFTASFPEFDESKTIEDTITLIFQVNGKVRDKIEVPRGLSREELEKFATSNERVQKHIGSAEVKKMVVVPDKLVNVVVG